MKRIRAWAWAQGCLLEFQVLFAGGRGLRLVLVGQEQGFWDTSLQTQGSGSPGDFRIQPVLSEPYQLALKFNIGGRGCESGFGDPAYFSGGQGSLASPLGKPQIILAPRSLHPKPLARNPDESLRHQGQPFWGPFRRDPTIWGLGSLVIVNPRQAACQITHLLTPLPELEVAFGVDRIGRLRARQATWFT